MGQTAGESQNIVGNKYKHHLFGNEKKKKKVLKILLKN